MANLEELSPSYVGEDRIALTLADPQVPILANVPFQVNVDVSATLPEGLVLPIELVVSGPSTGQYKRRLFTKSVPNSLLITPTVRGSHFILIRELFHNRWQGRLTVEVRGDDLQPGQQRVL